MSDLEDAIRLMDISELGWDTANVYEWHLEELFTDVRLGKKFLKLLKERQKALGVNRT